MTLTRRQAAHRVTALALLTLLGAAASAQAQQLKLRLMETTDIHMAIKSWDYYQDKPVEDYGLERTATLIKAARAEVKNSLLFENGDLLQGNPLGDYVARIKPPAAGQLHPAFRVMKALGYDAANVGNHEFNYGLPFLRRTHGSAPFPVVNSNVVLEDGKPLEAATHAFNPTVMLTRTVTDEAGQTHTLKIGVLGFVPPQILQWDRAHLQGQVRALDIPSTARRLVPQLKAAGADVVVVIAHSGFERGTSTPLFAENTVARLAEVPGVHAVLFGHSHGEFPGAFFGTHPKVDISRGTINGVPAVMPGFWGSHLGVVDLTLEKTAEGWQVRDGSAHLRAVYDRANRKALVQPDPEVGAMIKDEHEGTLAFVRGEVARTTEPIQSYFAMVADDPSVQLVSNAQIAYGRQILSTTRWAHLPVLSAAAPFKTGGRGGTGYYTDIPAGPLALRNVADLYIYPNTVDVVKLSGAQVREWLEFAAGAFRRIDPQGPGEQDLLEPGFPSYNYDTIDGVTYRIDVTQPRRYDRDGKLVAPEARRIVDLRFRGQPIDEQAEFAVVTNNYRASGGGNFPGLDGRNIIVSAPDENRQVLVDYLQAQKVVTPTADGNWRFAPVPGVKLRFVAGTGALPHLPRYPQIRLVQDRGNGSALLELTP